MRVAIVHDYLNQYGGAERVLEALHEPTPMRRSTPDLSTRRLCQRPTGVGMFAHSWMQRLPGWRRAFRAFSRSTQRVRELRPERLRTDPQQQQRLRQGRDPAAWARHICYCHTPMRFAWRTDDYVEREGIGGAARALLSILLTYKYWAVGRRHHAACGSIRGQLARGGRAHPALLWPRGRDHPAARRSAALSPAAARGFLSGRRAADPI